MATIPTGIHVTYRLEKHTCGKARCRKCRAGGPQAGHGPYWYAYWHIATPGGGTRLTSGYVGKTLPAGVPVPGSAVADLAGPVLVS